MKRPFRTIILLFALAATACIVGIVWSLQRPLPINGERTVHIARRTTIAGAIDSIDAQCTLPTPSLVRVTARLMARFTQRPVQHGWYVFTAMDTQWDVVMAVLSGRHRPAIRVTIPEGLTYREIAGILRQKAEIDSSAFVAWCENDSVVKKYTHDAPSMEGYLSPNTYDVLWRDEAGAIGERLATELQTVWGSLDTEGSRKEILTLASIVQAEAANVSEMPKISGVYANRLKRGMKLEADPTVQYGIGMKRRVMYRDLDDAHAYNTYLHTGLPPGPIGNPGTDAIRAALKPENHSYIYFVARGDSTGLHRFARTGAEHMENVRLYRRSRR